MSSFNYYNNRHGYNRHNDRDVNISGKGETQGLTVTRVFNDNYRPRGGGGYNNRGGGRGYHGHNNHGRGYRRGGNSRGGGGGGGGGRVSDGGRSGPKKLPGNMVERKEEPMHQQVRLALTIMTKLGDYTSMEEDNDLHQNIKDLANIFLTVGDLREHASDIADIFIKCFSQLSVQSSIIAALLALIHTLQQQPQHQHATSDTEKLPDSDDAAADDDDAVAAAYTGLFSELVVQKLQGKLATVLAQDNIPIARLLLRAIGCLAAAGVWAIGGDGGLLEILQLLLRLSMEGAANAAEFASKLEDNYTTAHSAAPSDSGAGKVPCFGFQPSATAECALYLLASTLPWVAKALHAVSGAYAAAPASGDAHEQGVSGSAAEFLSEVRSVLAAVRKHYRSPYAAGGVQAVLVWQSQSTSEGEGSVDHNTVLSAGPTTVFSADDVAPAAASGAAYDSLWEACHAAVLALDLCSEEAGIMPSCFVRPWEQLAADGLLLSVPGVCAPTPAPTAAPTATAVTVTTTVDSDGDAAMEGAEESGADADVAAAGPEVTVMPTPLRFSAGAFKSILKKKHNTSHSDNASSDAMGGMLQTDADQDDDDDDDEDYTGATTGVLALGSSVANCVVEQSTGSLVTSTIGSHASCKWLRARFSLIDADASEEAGICCQALSPLEKCAAFSYLQDVLEFFEPIVNEDGTMLGSMELLTSHLLAVFKLFPDNSRMDYLLMEMLMQIILQQPTNETLSAKVFRLVLELCRQGPTRFPPVVALATNVVFQLVGELDFCAVREFSRWFSFHLINTKLAWPYWSFWVGELQEEQQLQQLLLADSDADATALATATGAAAAVGPVELFLQNVIRGCSSAVVVDKLRSTLPTELHKYLQCDAAARCRLLPLSASTSDGAATMDAEDSDGAAVGNEASTTAVEEEAAVIASLLGHIPHIAAAATSVRDKIQEDRVDADDLCDFLEALASPSQLVKHNAASLITAEDGSGAVNDVEVEVDVVGSPSKEEITTVDGEPLCWRGSLLLHVLLEIGGSVAPLSGTTAMLDKYAVAITALASTERDHLDLLDMLHEIYGHAAHMFSFCLDEMMRRQQLSVVAVARWLLNRSNALNSSGASISTGAINEDLCCSSVELLVDRATDFVRAAVAQRVQFSSGDDLVLDMRLDLTPTPEPERPVKQKATSGGAAAVNMLDAGADAGADMQDSNTKRRKRGAEEDVDDGTGGYEQEDREEESGCRMRDDDGEEEGGNIRKRARRGDEEESAFILRDAADMAAAAAAAADAAGDAAADGIGFDANGTGATGISGTGNAGNGMEVRMNGDDIEDDDDDDDDDDDVVDPVWASGEAVKTAFKASRNVYQYLVTALVRTLEHHCHLLTQYRADVSAEVAQGGGDVAIDGSDASGEGNISSAAAARVTHTLAQIQVWSSLLRRVLRSFHGAERSLTVEHARCVVATAPAAQVRELLSRAVVAMNSISEDAAWTCWQESYFSRKLHQLVDDM